MRYLYLPRLKSRGVLEQAIVKGAASRDFFGTAYSQTGDRFDGFKFGDANIQLDDTLLLIEPETAKAYAAAHAQAAPATSYVPSKPGHGAGQIMQPDSETPAGGPKQPASGPVCRAFIGTVEVNAATAKMRLVEIAEEIITLLTSDPQATVKVSVEIAASFPDGVSDQIKRSVSENATSLGFKNKSWE
jgi:hypothetical protein